jgi:ribosome-associated toxin RatA of RatAB toxin-antitoxin module
MPYVNDQGSNEVYRHIIRLISGVIFFLFLFNLSTGCSVKHHRASDKYSQYEGEINQHTRLIQAESVRIFHILTHQDAFKSICPKGTIVTFEPILPYRVGTIVNTKIDHLFKLSWRSRVVEIDQYRKIRLQFLNGFFVGGTEIWELAPENTSTRVTHTIIFQHSGFLKKLAWNLKVRRKHNKMVEAVLDKLKRTAETE